MIPTIGAERSQKIVLMGLQYKPHVYAGTVPPETVAKRRAKNRVARVSRRVNRARSG